MRHILILSLLVVFGFRWSLDSGADVVVPPRFKGFREKDSIKIEKNKNEYINKISELFSQEIKFRSTLEFPKFYDKVKDEIKNEKDRELFEAGARATEKLALSHDQMMAELQEELGIPKGKTLEQAMKEPGWRERAREKGAFAVNEVLGKYLQPDHDHAKNLEEAALFYQNLNHGKVSSTGSSRLSPETIKTLNNHIEEYQVPGNQASRVLNLSTEERSAYGDRKKKKGDHEAGNAEVELNIKVQNLTSPLFQHPLRYHLLLDSLKGLVENQSVIENASNVASRLGTHINKAVLMAGGAILFSDLHQWAEENKARLPKEKNGGGFDCEDAFGNARKSVWNKLKRPFSGRSHTEESNDPKKRSLNIRDPLIKTLKVYQLLSSLRIKSVPS
jgi:hypothetical protein